MLLNCCGRFRLSCRTNKEVLSEYGACPFLLSLTSSRPFSRACPCLLMKRLWILTCPTQLCQEVRREACLKSSGSLEEKGLKGWGGESSLISKLQASSSRSILALRALRGQCRLDLLQVPNCGRIWVVVIFSHLVESWKGFRDFLVQACNALTHPVVNRIKLQFLQLSIILPSTGKCPCHVLASMLGNAPCSSNRRDRDQTFQ